MSSSLLRFGFCLLGLVCLGSAGCSLDRFSKVNEEPELSPMSDPTLAEDYRPVTLPMPTPEPRERQVNSLWRSGSRAFFQDLRASRIGDIVTVRIDVQDSAQLSNQTSRARSSEEDLGIGGLAGFGETLQDILPGTPDLGNLVDTESDSNSSGSGSIQRNESIQMNVAAVVTQRLPNGNLVIYGRQELRVNFEVRELHVAGIIRPQDIDANNAIAFDKIAEARVAYGGRGQITDVQQPRWGQQVADIILPF